MRKAMLKTHKQTKTEEIDVVDDIVCNRCGKSCKDKCDMNFEGLLEVTVQGGYASLLGDSHSYVFSICESCLKEMFEKEFKIAPEDHPGMFG
jgi:hypothetical protein